MDRVCAVIVTYNRKELLRECLRAVLSQTRPPDHVLVVDNASTDGTPEMLREEFPQVEVLRLPENQGGAGGFHEGMRRAYEGGYEWIWVFDDDTFLQERTALEEMLSLAVNVGADVLSPLPRALSDPRKSAFEFFFNGRWTFEADAVAEVEQISWGQLSLFLGVLLRRSVIEKAGLPMKELFIRGEDFEYALRILRSGLKVARLNKRIVLHPDSHDEIAFMLPRLGRLVFPVFKKQDKKAFYTYRNRMYIFKKYFKPWQIWTMLEIARYAWFFLVKRRFDIKGFVFWKKAAWLGLKENFVSYEDFR